MSTYLPKDSSNGSSYQEGGGLYAIGLIHANHGRGKITDYLHTQLSGASNEVSAFVMRCVSNPRSPRGFTCNLPCDMNKCKSAVSLFCDASHGVWCLCAWFVLKSISSWACSQIIIHGGCLGLGLAALGSANNGEPRGWCFYVEIERYISRYLGFADISVSADFIGLSRCWQNAVIFLTHPYNLRKKAQRSKSRQLSCSNASGCVFINKQTRWTMKQSQLNLKQSITINQITKNYSKILKLLQLENFSS